MGGEEVLGVHREKGRKKQRKPTKVLNWEERISK
jgi:hypothetical protein